MSFIGLVSTSMGQAGFVVPKCEPQHLVTSTSAVPTPSAFNAMTPSAAVSAACFTCPTLRLPCHAATLPQPGNFFSSEGQRKSTNLLLVFHWCSGDFKKAQNGLLLFMPQSGSHTAPQCFLYSPKSAVNDELPRI